MEQETTVKKINTITVSSKTFSGRAMVYQCTMCQSRFVDMDDNYRLCPYCGRKIVDKKETEMMKHKEKLEVFGEVKADCCWHEKQQAELKEAARPLVEYLRKYCTPMHVAIVDAAGVDVYAKDVNVPID